MDFMDELGGDHIDQPSGKNIQYSSTDTLFAHI